MLNEHLNHAGLRAVCGSSRPCDRVQVTEHTVVQPVSWSDRRRWAPNPSPVLPSTRRSRS